MNAANLNTRQPLARAVAITLLAATSLHWFSSPVLAQQAAPAAAAGFGPRGAGPGTLTRQQRNAAIKIDATVTPPMQAAAAARTNLNLAVFVEKPEAAIIKLKADALGAAELALARARADEFVKLQASELKLSGEQTATLVRNSLQTGRAGGAPTSTGMRRPGFLADRAALLSQGGPQLVFLGDSITDQWRNRSGTIFNDNFAKYRTYNIGISGIRYQDVLDQIELGDLDGTSPKAAMVMIGTNNLPGGQENDESVAAGIAEVVGDIRKKLPNTRILLLGIFPRAVSATDPLRTRIKNINGIISKLDDGGKFVKYLDIGEKFLAADGTLTAEIMLDALHPNAAGYQIWADAVKDTLAEMLK